MKKFSAVLLAVLMIAAIFAISSFAAFYSEGAQVVKDKVLKATATVDGKLDAAYTQSLTVKLNPPKYAGAETNVKATVYALYDNNFVYVFYSVENDTTLMTTDDDYIMNAIHPSLNDAVELRIGDDLEEHLPYYNGSNADHHLFLMDAYGKRFSCYEDAMDEYCDKMKGKAVRGADGKSYTVEMAIPVVNPFNEGDIIQFNFQIDDLQDDIDTTGYIGLGTTYMTLNDFTIGGPASGATVVDTPDEKPVENKPVENKPVENKPVENKPADDKTPVSDPKKDPVAVEGDAEVDGDAEVTDGEENPEENAEVEGNENPEENAEVEGNENPDEVTENKEDQDTSADDSKENDEKSEDKKEEEKGTNIGLIIGIIAAIIVVVGVVLFFVLKKKKAD